jgi:subtilisin family serine protease
MAAPHVAGAAALIIAAGAARQEVRSILQETAQRLDEVPNPAGVTIFGAGLLDVAAALLRATTATVRLVSPANNMQTYLRTIPIQIQISNLPRLASPADVTVVIRTANTPSTIIRTFVGGRDFAIPAPNPANPAAPVVITMPSVVLPPGDYVVEAG